MSQPDHRESDQAARYIHEDGVSASLADLTVKSEGSVADSGSSIEEEIDQEIPDASPEPDDEQVSSGVEPGRLEDFAYLDERRNHSDGEEDSEESDWAVDDEDWELANGGQ